MREHVHAPSVARVTAAAEAKGYRLKQVPGGFLTYCPAHDDLNSDRPGLSIRQGQAGVLLKCQSRDCPVEEIAGGFGLSVAELFDDWRPNGATPPVREHIYRDAEGKILFRKRKLSNGRWVTDPVGAPKVLYNLDGLTRADAASTLYICEGERDADSAVAAGALGTTNPHGCAEKWRKEYLDVIRRFTLVRVVVDRDEPGRLRGRYLADLLESEGLLYEVLEPAQGKDLCEHLGAGFAIHELVPVAVEEAPPVNGLVVRSASSVEPQQVEWVIEGRVPRAALTLMVGLPGLGKSTVSLNYTAQVTRGTADGDLAQPANVIIMSAEDSESHTIVPRLLAAGANLDRVFFIKMVRDGLESGIVLPDDLALVEAEVVAKEVALLIVDPLMAHIPLRLDAHRDHHIRAALAPLARLADRTGVAVLAVGHLNKAPSTNFFEKVGGSIGLTAAARSALLVALDPEDEQQRVLLHAKSNVGERRPAVRFSMCPAQVQHGSETIETSRIEWGPEVPGLQTDEVLASDGADERSALAEAKDFLKDILMDGPMPGSEVLRAGLEAGLANRTLHRAKRDLKVGANRVSTAGGSRGAGRWYWELPPMPFKATIEGGHLEDSHVEVSPVIAGHKAHSALPNDQDGRVNKVAALNDEEAGRLLVAEALKPGPAD